jgi:hypothetical protein
MKQFIKKKLNILLEQKYTRPNAFSTMNDYYIVGQGRKKLGLCMVVILMGKC